MHTLIDVYSRFAYPECHDDETAATVAGVLYRFLRKWAPTRRGSWAVTLTSSLASWRGSPGTASTPPA